MKKSGKFKLHLSVGIVQNFTNILQVRSNKNKLFDLFKTVQLNRLTRNSFPVSRWCHFFINFLIPSIIIIPEYIRWHTGFKFANSNFSTKIYIGGGPHFTYACTRRVLQVFLLTFLRAMESKNRIFCVRNMWMTSWLKYILTSHCGIRCRNLSLLSKYLCFWAQSPFVSQQ